MYAGEILTKSSSTYAIKEQLYGGPLCIIVALALAGAWP
jgi:hypothetical protein